MSGILGIYANKKADVASDTYYGLFALQHRGQESCGIVVNDDGVFTSYKDKGIVNDVFTKDILDNLGQGNMALGQVRYGTAGSKDRKNSQPIVVNHIKGSMAIAHNGNLVNSFELRKELELQGSIFHSTSDPEVIAYIITKERLSASSIEEAVTKAVTKIDGAFSLVVMSPTKMIAVRDKYGFRPLCYGKTDDGSYIIASESCAISAIGAKFIRDVEPGEIIVFSRDGVRSIKDHCNTAKRSSCVFEYIYFARPDSVVDGFSVNAARMKAGAFLAKEHPVDADLVVGVPDSGIDAAVGYARESGIPYGVGLIKNKYIGRTFIQPGQKSREDLVKIKLSPVLSAVKGKRIVLIDDSIVRGTTCARIVGILRDAGATEVHMRVSAPPFINPCYYGTDIDSKNKLIACNHSVEEISEIIGVDSLGYLSLEHTKLIANEASCDGYCTACFDGIYPTRAPKSDKEKYKFETKISESGGDE